MQTIGLIFLPEFDATDRLPQLLTLVDAGGNIFLAKISTARLEENTVEQVFQLFIPFGHEYFMHPLHVPRINFSKGPTTSALPTKTSSILSSVDLPI